MTAVFAEWFDPVNVPLNPWGKPFADLERFDSLRDARDAFWQRYHAGSPVTFHYLDERGTGDWLVPCVSEQAEMLLYFYDPRESHGDAYPNRLLRLGPRGGVIAEYC